MKLLPDTHVFLALLDLGSTRLPTGFDAVLDDPSIQLHVSVASLWEIAIKVRSKKLDIGMGLDALTDASHAAGVAIFSIEYRHVLAEATPPPATRDPFDRLLLAQASVEGMRLVTLDRALAAHPLAWAPTTP